MVKKKVSIVQIEVEGFLIDAKECTKCEIVKSLADFNNKSNGLGKKESFCKLCRKAYGDRRKEEKALYDKTYREENKEKLQEQKKKWWEENREYANEGRKDRYYANHEEEKDYRKLYHHTHKEKLNEKKKVYYKENTEKFKTYREVNKDKIKAHAKKKYDENKVEYAIRWREYYQSERGQEVTKQISHRRRAREKEVIATLTSDQWSDCKSHFKQKCAYCGNSDKITLDHFVPVSKGGELAVKNVIPACGSCNSSKRDKLFAEWYVIQDFYSEARERAVLKYLGYKDNQQQIAFF